MHIHPVNRQVYTVTISSTGRLLKRPKQLYQASELVYRLVETRGPLETH